MADLGAFEPLKPYLVDDQAVPTAMFPRPFTFTGRNVAVFRPGPERAWFVVVLDQYEFKLEVWKIDIAAGTSVQNTTQTMAPVVPNLNGLNGLNFNAYDVARTASLNFAEEARPRLFAAYLGPLNVVILTFDVFRETFDRIRSAPGPFVDQLGSFATFHPNNRIQGAFRIAYHRDTGVNADGVTLYYSRRINERIQTSLARYRFSSDSWDESMPDPAGNGLPVRQTEAKALIQAGEVINLAISFEYEPGQLASIESAGLRPVEARVDSADNESHVLTSGLGISAQQYVGNAIESRRLTEGNPIVKISAQTQDLGARTIRVFRAAPGGQAGGTIGPPWTEEPVEQPDFNASLPTLAFCDPDDRGELSGNGDDPGQFLYALGNPDGADFKGIYRASWNGTIWGGWTLRMQFSAEDGFSTAGSPLFFAAHGGDDHVLLTVMVLGDEVLPSGDRSRNAIFVFDPCEGGAGSLSSPAA